MRRGIDIISDGTGLGTRITNADGMPITGVTELGVAISMNGTKATLEFAEGRFALHLYNVTPRLIPMYRWSLRWPFLLNVDVHPQDFGNFYMAGYRRRR